MSSWTRNLDHVVRGCLRTPGFTATAVIVSSVGIGATAGVFTVIDTLALKPLSGRADELLGVYCGSRTRPDSFQAHSYLNYADMRDRSGLFDGLLAHTFVMVGEPAGDGVRRILSEFVSSNYFATLGTPLAAGRTFTPDEERPGARVPVAIVSYPRWKAANLALGMFDAVVRDPRKSSGRPLIDRVAHVLVVAGAVKPGL